MYTKPQSYRRDVDGLRALAVLAVVFYHAFPGTIRGGFVGVDVFFVISGFLISGLVGRQIDDGNFSLAGFYGRRVRRIFPALAAVLTATLGYGLLVLLPRELAQLGKHVAAGAGFVSNLIFWNEAGYFDRASAAKPLLHLWSLGVEEQFYIAWPLILWSVMRINMKPLICIAMLTAASFALNIVAARGEGVADFYSPLTRLWELSAGSLLALWMLRHVQAEPGIPVRGRMRHGVSVAGLALICGAVVFLDQRMRYPDWLAVLPVAGTVLLIAAGPVAWANRLLSGKLAVGIGLFSYPLYLWHWPLLSYASIIGRGHAPKPLLSLGLISASVVLAVLTYRFLELPVRMGIRARRTTALLLVSMGCVGVAGAYVWNRNALEVQGAGLHGIDIAKVNAAIDDGIFRATRDMRVTRVNGLTVAEIGAGPGAVLLMGDSLLYQFGPRVQRLFEEGRLTRTVYFLTGPSCAPIPGATRPDRFAQCSTLPDVAMELIARHHVERIVLGAYWAADQGKDLSVERGGRRMPIDTPQAVDAVYSNLEDYVSGLVRSGHSVYLILSTPINARFNPRDMISRSMFGYKLNTDDLAGVPADELHRDAADVNQRLIAIAKNSGAEVLDPYPDVCGPSNLCSSLFDGEPKFADHLHLRPMFVETNIHFLDRILEQ